MAKDEKKTAPASEKAASKPEPVRLHIADSKGQCQRVYDALTKAKLPARLSKLKSGKFFVETSSRVLDEAKKVLEATLAKPKADKSKAAVAEKAEPSACEVVIGARQKLEPNEACQLKPGALVNATFHNEGQRWVAGRVEMANYDAATTKKVKGKTVEVPASGSVNLTTYPVNSLSKNLTLSLSEGKLVSLRGVEHELFVPNSKEIATIGKIIDKEKVLRAEAEAAAAKSEDGKESEVKSKTGKKSAKPAKERKVRSGSFDGGSKITVLKKENPFSGKRGKKHALLLKSATVAAYQKAMRDAGLGSIAGPLRRAVSQKLVKVG